MAFRAQAPESSAQSNSASPVAVLKSGPGIESAKLSTTDFSTITSTSCEQRVTGKIGLSLIVDTSGKAQNIVFTKPDGTDLDRLAIVVAQMDRFMPANQAGNAIATGSSLELELQGCLVNTPDTQRQKAYHLLLASSPRQILKPDNSFPVAVIFAQESIEPDVKVDAATGLRRASTGIFFPKSGPERVGKGLSAPIPIYAPEAEFAEDATGRKITGECLVSLMVDAFGLPQSLKVVRSFSPNADQKAIEAANRYRFKPAMYDGMQPFPRRITIAVNFRCPNC